MSTAHRGAHRAPPRLSPFAGWRGMPLRGLRLPGRVGRRSSAGPLAAAGGPTGWRRFARALAGPVTAVAAVAAVIAVVYALGGQPVRLDTGATVRAHAAGPTPAAGPVTHQRPPARVFRPPGPVASTRPVPPSSAPTAAARPELVVLNNSRVTGLAARAAATFTAGGWPVASIGNLRGRIAETTVYFAPGYAGTAGQLAQRFPQVTRVLPRLPWLPDAPLVVVVTRYWVQPAA